MISASASAVGAWRPVRLAICVPVKNEQRLLPRLFDALARQTAPADVRIALCRFFDGCNDDSLAVASRCAAVFPFPLFCLEGPRERDANAGRARRAALSMGQESGRGESFTALLTTDADSAPAPDWLVANCRALGQADIVAGRIVRRSDPTRPDQGSSRIITTAFTRCGAGSIR